MRQKQLVYFVFPNFFKEIYQKDGIKTKWSKHLEVDFYVKLIDGTLTLVDDYENPSEFHHLFDNVDFDYEVS